MGWDFTKDNDLIEAAMGIIANVGSRNGQGWEAQHPEWQEAARNWMEGYADNSSIRIGREKKKETYDGHRS